jgi:YVTN family beta-propeller protein
MNFLKRLLPHPARSRWFVSRGLALAAALWSMSVTSQAQTAFRIYVTNEKSGDVTIIDGESLKVVGSVAAGKRPRGIVVSPDGKTLFVAVSGTPISAPPKLDAKGNPIFDKKKGKDDDDDDDKNADKSADGIAVIDLIKNKLVKKIKVGSDPEQLALSKDGRQLYVSNEDVATASILDIETGKVLHIIPVSREPEGVATAPSGGFFYVTCEADGEIYAIDSNAGKTIAHFNVGGRPRSAAFLPDGSRAYIPSESAGQLHMIDTTYHKLLKTAQLPTGCRPMGLCVGADGKKVYASTGRAGTVCVCDASSLEVVSNIKVGVRPWGIALSPDGKRLYSANGPSDDISVVDLESQKELQKVKAGSSPWGVAIGPKISGIKE